MKEIDWEKSLEYTERILKRGEKSLKDFEKHPEKYGAKNDSK